MNHEVDLHKNAAKNFLSALELNSNSIGSIGVNVFSGKSTLGNTTRVGFNGLSGSIQTVHLSFHQPISEEIGNEAANINSIRGLTDFMRKNDTTIKDVKKNSHSIQSFSKDNTTLRNNDIDVEAEEAEDPIDDGVLAEIPIDSIYKYLSPLIEESKIYLKSKGFTDLDIKEMLIENDAKEEDLVPFVTGLSYLEEHWNNTLGKTKDIFNIVPFFFTHSAMAKDITWQDVGQCAMEAIGVDAFYSLMFSGAGTGSWTVPLLKKVFTNVAKRFLGPIGVAIVVVQFTWCLGGW